MSVWDKMPAHTRAVDRNAANAVKGGCGHDVTVKPADHIAHWDAPPRMCLPPKDAPDYVGRVIGRLTVVGWLADVQTGKNGARWVVRCACGQYEVRRSKALNQPVDLMSQNRRQMCRRCDRLEYVKRQGGSGKGAT